MIKFRVIFEFGSEMTIKAGHLHEAIARARRLGHAGAGQVVSVSEVT
jgi:hypothetical protein